jgi:Multiubiquitin
MLEDREHDEHRHGAAADESEELIDLEEWAKAGKTAMKAKVYRIRIDKEKFDVKVPSMTGREILALVNKTPEKYLLSLKIRGGAPVPIEPDQTVRFDMPGIERFQTLARDPTEG